MRSTVVPLTAPRSRDPRIPRAIDARRRLARTASGERPAGRVWINGREVGGADPRYAHLEHGHD